MKTIGLTGGIGSGKTTVANIFSALGIPIYFADFEAKKFLLNSEVQHQLAEWFGPSIIQNHQVDKAKLASIIFSDEESLKKVNGLIHPKLRAHFKEWASRQEDFPYCIMEAAILFENGFNTVVDYSICVSAPEEERIQRSMKRDGSSREQILQRIQNQWSQEKIIQLSDFQINNSDNKPILSEILAIDHKFREGDFSPQ